MKNTFSFRHDYGARNDPKVKKMIARLGPAAGWAWWVAIEELYEQGGRLPIDCIPEIAYDARVDEDMMRSVIQDFGLFKVEKKEFYSVRASLELREREERESSARKSAKARWDKEKKQIELCDEQNAGAEEKDCGSNATAMRTQSKRNAINDDKINDDKIREDYIDADASSPGEPEGGLLFPGEEKSEPELKPSQFVEVWNRVVKETGSVIKPVEYAAVSEKLRSKIKVRISEMAKVGNPREVLENTLRKACASDFCNCATNEGWLMKFDWFIKNGENWNKVYRGNYDNRTGGKKGEYDRLRVKVESPEEYEGEF